MRLLNWENEGDVIFSLTPALDSSAETHLHRRAPLLQLQHELHSGSAGGHLSSFPAMHGFRVS